MDRCYLRINVNCIQRCFLGGYFVLRINLAIDPGEATGMEKQTIYNKKEQTMLYICVVLFVDLFIRSVSLLHLRQCYRQTLRCSTEPKDSIYLLVK